MAIMNILQLAGGKERYTMIDNNTWDMILGKAGKLPGELDPEIIRIATAHGKEFYTGVPQDAYPDELEKYRKEMAENNWEHGQDDEELFELAIHDKQYRDYKSGIAKTRFENELAKAIEQAKTAIVSVPVIPEVPKAEPEKPKKPVDPDIREILSPVKGRIYYDLFGEHLECNAPGESISKGSHICYIESNVYIDEITCPYNGVIVECHSQHGANVKKGQLLLTIREIKPS
jgi:pyruvate carboxylase subunit B